MISNKGEIYRYSRTSNDKKKVMYLLFLLSPLLGFLYSIFHIKTRAAFVVFFIFTIVFGLSLDLPYGKLGVDLNVDGAAYRVYFEEIAIKQNIDTWFRELKDFYLLSGDNKDYYMQTLAFISSSITNNYRMMFMLGAMFFSLFQLKCLKILVLNEKFTLSFVTICMLYIFCRYQIISINELRFPTASWIICYIILNIVLYNKWSVLFLLPVLPLVHGSSFFFIILVIFAYIVKRPVKLWEVLFMISVFSSGILEFTSSYIENMLPPFLSHYMTDNAGDEVLSKSSDATDRRASAAYIKVFGFISRYYIDILILLLIHSYHKFRAANKVETLYKLFVIIFTIANFISFIPTASWRFRNVLYPVLIILWINIVPSRCKLNRVFYLVPIVFAYDIVMQGYLYYRIVDPLFWIMSPLLNVPRLLFM